MVSDMSRYVNQRYLVMFDVGQRHWKIVDLQDNSMMGVGLDDDIPDELPAVIILSELAVNELFKEAQRLGFIGSGEEGSEIRMVTSEVEGTEDERLSKQAIKAILDTIRETDNPALAQIAIVGILKAVGAEEPKK